METGDYFQRKLVNLTFFPLSVFCLILETVKKNILSSLFLQPQALLGFLIVFFWAYLPNNQKKMENQILAERVERQEEKVGDRGEFQLVSVFLFFLLYIGCNFPFKKKKIGFLIVFIFIRFTTLWKELQIEMDQLSKTRHKERSIHSPGGETRCPTSRHSWQQVASTLSYKTRFLVV